MVDSFTKEKLRDSFTVPVILFSSLFCYKIEHCKIEKDFFFFFFCLLDNSISRPNRGRPRPTTKMHRSLGSKQFLPRRPSKRYNLRSYCTTQCHGYEVRSPIPSQVSGSWHCLYMFVVLPVIGYDTFFYQIQNCWT